MVRPTEFEFSTRTMGSGSSKPPSPLIREWLIELRSKLEDFFGKKSSATVSDAAKLLEVSQSAIRRYAAKHGIKPPFCKGHVVQMAVFRGNESYRIEAGEVFRTPWPAPPAPDTSRPEIDVYDGIEQLSKRLIAKKIVTFGDKVTLVCDGRCDKAWGIMDRPSRKLGKHPDDYVFVADSELPIAPEPEDIGTSEGGHGKPSALGLTDGSKMNKWCSRQCERSTTFEGWPPDLASPEPNMRAT